MFLKPLTGSLPRPEMLKVFAGLCVELSSRLGPWNANGVDVIDAGNHCSIETTNPTDAKSRALPARSSATPNGVSVIRLVRRGKPRLPDAVPARCLCNFWTHRALIAHSNGRPNAAAGELHLAKLFKQRSTPPTVTITADAVMRRKRSHNLTGFRLGLAGRVKPSN